jgi:hypothetical protein
VRVIGPDRLHRGETGVYRFTPDLTHSSITWSAVGGDPGDRDGPTFSLTMIRPETVYIRVTLGRPDGSATPPSAPFAVQFVADPPAPEAAPPTTAAEPPATTTAEAPTTTATTVPPTTTTTAPPTTTTEPTTTTTEPPGTVLHTWSADDFPNDRYDVFEDTDTHGRKRNVFGPGEAVRVACRAKGVPMSSNPGNWFYRISEPAEYAGWWIPATNFPHNDAGYDDRIDPC